MPKFIIEDMQAANGDGWWNGMWRFVGEDETGYVHIGEPQGTKEAAEADLEQYKQQLEAEA